MPEEAPFDPKILGGCIEAQSHMVENENKFNGMNMNMEVEYQIDLNMGRKGTNG